MAVRSVGLPLPLPVSLGGTGVTAGPAVMQFSQYATVTVSPTAEATILGTVRGSKTLAAGALNTLGKTLQIDGGGSYTTTSLAPGKLTVRVYLGATLIGSAVISSLMTGATGGAFDYAGTIVCTTVGGAGVGQVRLQARISFDISANTRGFASIVSTTTVDLTAAQALNITAQWAGAGVGTGANSITNNVAVAVVI